MLCLACLLLISLLVPPSPLSPAPRHAAIVSSAMCLDLSAIRAHHTTPSPSLPPRPPLFSLPPPRSSSSTRARPPQKPHHHNYVNLPLCSLSTSPPLSLLSSPPSPLLSSPLLSSPLLSSPLLSFHSIPFHSINRPFRSDVPTPRASRGWSWVRRRGPKDCCSLVD